VTLDTPIRLYRDENEKFYLWISPMCGNRVLCNEIFVLCTIDTQFNTPLSNRSGFITMLINTYVQWDAERESCFKPEALCFKSSHHLIGGNHVEKWKSFVIIGGLVGVIINMMAEVFYLIAINRFTALEDIVNTITDYALISFVLGMWLSIVIIVGLSGWLTVETRKDQAGKSP